MGARAPDLTGRAFGHLTVLSREGSSQHGASLWRCRCDCADKTELLVEGGALRKGYRIACGCVPSGRKPGSEVAARVLYEHDGVRQGAQAWADHLGISLCTFYERLRHGRPDLVFTGLRRRKPRPRCGYCGEKESDLERDGRGWMCRDGSGCAVVRRTG